VLRGVVRCCVREFRASCGRQGESAVSRFWPPFSSAAPEENFGALTIARGRALVWKPLPFPPPVFNCAPSNPNLNVSLVSLNLSSVQVTRSGNNGGDGNQHLAFAEKVRSFPSGVHAKNSQTGTPKKACSAAAKACSAEQTPSVDIRHTVSPLGVYISPVLFFEAKQKITHVSESIERSSLVSTRRTRIALETETCTWKRRPGAGKAQNGAGQCGRRYFRGDALLFALCGGVEIKL